MWKTFDVERGIILKIKFCGATTGVTGSCHLLTTGNHKVLLDCGQFQGGKKEEILNWKEFPFKPSEIEAVILSHAHIDHCGRIPLLVKKGFKGNVYCTKPTADLLDVMLKDSGYIHEKEAEYQTKKALRKGGKPVEPLYTFNDAVESLKYIKPVLYDQLITVNDNIKIVFNDAGHILGSAITEIWVKENDGESKIVFSGDLGMKNRPILRDPTIIKKADYLIMETTYGDRVHPEHTKGIQDLIDIIVKTVRRNGNVVIPSFAVGRTQELLFELNKFYDYDNEYSKLLSKIKVYVDSPMATRATEVFKENADVFDKETREFILNGDNPLEFRNLVFTATTEESKMINENNEPKIIISASGMCEAGRIRHHLKHNLWDSKNSVVFVGYQAEGTLGRYLLDGAKEIRLFGEDISVNCEIYNLQGFSGHADRDSLLSWASGFEKRPKQIFLVHGEKEAKESFAKLMETKLNYKPITVNTNSEFELDLNKGDILDRKEYAEGPFEEYDAQNLRSQLAEVHDEMERILCNANIAIDDETTKEKLANVSNALKELEKSMIQVGSSISNK